MLADTPASITDFLWLPGQPILSGLVWVVAGLMLLYVARLPAHKLIAVLFGGCNRLLRLLVKFLLGVNTRLRQRNRDVLLTRGQDKHRDKLEKSFTRIAAQVADDLSAWPSLHREMREQITRMDGEVTNAREQPLQPPEWLQVIEAVAQIPAQGSNVIAKVLADTHATLKSAMEKSLLEYQQANRYRYALLNRMIPQWRSMETQLTDMDKKVIRLDERTQVIDRQMQAYEQVLQGTDQAVNALTRSAASSLLLSTFLLFVACIGGIVNFQLLALPLSEVVGVHGDILGMRSSNVATAVVVLLQIVLGLFLLEAAGVTRLLPDIAQLEHRKRRSLMYLMMLVLTVMASMEALLIYTRDTLMTDNVLLNQLLAAPETTTTLSLDWIPSLGQVVIGFILPLVLIFSVIAFETFIYALRAVVGMFLSWLLEVMAMLIRLLASLMQLMARILIALYDLLIALPLYVERVLQNRKHAMSAKENNAVIAEPEE